MGSRPSSESRKDQTIQPQINKSKKGYEIGKTEEPAQEKAWSPEAENSENGNNPPNVQGDGDDDSEIIEENEEEEKSTSLEDHKEKLKTAIESLNEMKDYKSEIAYNHFVTLVKSASIKGKDKVKRRELAEFTIHLGLPELFSKIWDDLHLAELSKGHKKASKGENPTTEQQAMTNLKKMKMCFWNFTDCSEKFSDAMLNAVGCLRCLFADLDDPDLAVDKLKSDSRRYLLKGTLGIMHNIARLSQDGPKLFRSVPNSVELLQKCSTSTFLIIQAKTNLVLAFIMSEEEAGALATGSRCIGFLVGMLREAMNYSSHVSKKYNFSVLETAEGLNQLALSDKNKIAIVDNGAVPLLTEMLGAKFSEKEKLIAAQLLWRLAFVKENKPRLANSMETIHALVAVKCSENVELRNTALGALWEFFEGNLNLDFTSMDELHMKHPHPHMMNDVAVKDTGHLMISYQWDVQDQMIKVKEILESNNYKVWMDIEKMEGDILGAMADAVEKSAVVLVCFTERYKNSHSTRTEATYAYKQNKSIIPLMLEKDYQPDGWLGALIGTLKYFKLYDDNMLQSEIQALLGEIGDRGKKGGMVNFSHKKDNVQMPPTVIKMTNQTASSSAPTKGPGEWSTSEVKDWLVEHNLTTIISKLQEIDGPLLLQMKRQYNKAPEFFHRNIQSELGLDYVSILRFTKELEKL